MPDDEQLYEDDQSVTTGPDVPTDDTRDDPVSSDLGVVAGDAISSEDELSDEDVNRLQGRVADDSLDAVKAGGPIEVDDGYQTRPLDTLTREEREEHVRTAHEAAKANAEALEKAQSNEDRVNVEGGVESDGDTQGDASVNPPDGEVPEDESESDIDTESEVESEDSSTSDDTPEWEK